MEILSQNHEREIDRKAQVDYWLSPTMQLEVGNA